MNGAARNVHTQVFVWTGSHHSGCTLKRGTGESSGNPILALGRTFRLSCKDLYHSVFPPRVSPAPGKHVISCLFCYSHPSRCGI